MTKLTNIQLSVTLPAKIVEDLIKDAVEKETGKTAISVRFNIRQSSDWASERDMGGHIATVQGVTVELV